MGLGTSRSGAAILLLGLGASGCSVEDIVAIRVDTGTPRPDAGPPFDGGAAPVGGLPALPSVFRDGGPRMCACGGLSVSGAIRVDGPLGTEGDLDFSGELSVSGALEVGDEVRGSAVAARVGSLRVGAAWRSEALLEVDGDADVGGDLLAERLVVGGRLRQPLSATRQTSGGESLGSFESGPVPSPTPCGCDDASDVAPWIEELGPWPSPELLIPLQQTLTPERYQFEPPPTGSSLTLEVRGGAAWARIGGRLIVSSLRVQVPDPADALLLAIDGSFEIDNLSVEGSGRLIIVCADDGSVQLPVLGPTAPVDLWAPNAELVVPGPIDWSGQIVLRRLAAAGSVDLR